MQSHGAEREGAPFPDHPQRRSRHRSPQVRDRFGWGIAETLLACAAYLALREIGLVAPVPVWVFPSILLVSFLASKLAEAYWGPTCTQRELYLRVGVGMLGTTAAIYATGWGPALAVGYMFSLADSLKLVGARAAQPVLVWALVGLGLGQGGIAVGVVPTLVGAPTVHGIGLLVGLGVVFAVRVMGGTAAEKERAEAAVRRQERWFRSLVQHASDVITVVDAGGRVVYESPAVERVLGYGPVERVGAPFADFLHPDDRERLRNYFRERLDHLGAAATVELRARHRDGSWRWLEVSVTNLLDNPDIRGIVSNYRDITERKVLEEELRWLALYDSLTRLANRSLLRNRVQHALTLRSRQSAPLALLFLDLDNFKTINDSLGYAAGDQVLIMVADRLRACLRPAETVARLGGDEFGILIEDMVDASDAARIAERIGRALRAPFSLAGKEIVVEGSTGIAISTDGLKTADELLRDAEVAMYRAKAQGRGRYMIFEPTMHREVVRRLELEADLRRAIQRQEFVLHYQPIVALQTGQIVGVEALLRWQHPERGLLFPADFLSLAEETGLILPLGRWVLQEATRQTVQWQAQFPQDPPLAVAVNLSGWQLQQPELAQEVAQVLAASGLNPHHLILEITETAMMQHDTAATISRLYTLKGLGVRLAVDDFGTGYSSLSRLRELPLDILKIDKSFVDGLGAGPEASALARVIVVLAFTLHLQLLAEGIERPEQLYQLRILGCHLGQGYYFAEPLVVERLTALLQQARIGAPWATGQRLERRA